jgi:peptidoglycan-N-acetylglucosamine deacetylase
VNPPLSRRFCFTTSWDDGTVHDLRLAELLSKYDLPATFYIARSHPYGRLPEKEIRELATRFELGAHTLNHPVLTRVSDEVASGEIRDSKLWIEQLAGRPCEMFCFPRGKFRRRHLEIASHAGFLGTRTVELLSIQRPALKGNVRVMATTLQCFPHTSSAYLRNIASRATVSHVFRYLRTIRGKPWITAARLLFQEASQRGGVFHLWGHAWELEQLGMWPQLDILFRVAAEFRAQGRYVTNAELCE